MADSMTAILSAGSSIVGFVVTTVGSITGLIIAQPLLLIPVGFSLTFMAIRVFHTIKG